MNAQQFWEKFNACTEAPEWCAGKSLREAWETAQPHWLVWMATRRGVLDDRTLRLFACFCARQIWHLMTDERSKRAVEVAERYVAGSATAEELSIAWLAAWDAVKAANVDAATARAAALDSSDATASTAALAEAKASAAATAECVVWAAACDTAADAAWAAAHGSVWAASSSAASASTKGTDSDSARRAAEAVAWAAQADWLRANAKPEFE